MHVTLPYVIYDVMPRAACLLIRPANNLRMMVLCMKHLQTKHLQPGVQPSPLLLTWHCA
jgi:hypothetical protein